MSKCPQCNGVGKTYDWSCGECSWGFGACCGSPEIKDGDCPTCHGSGDVSEERIVTCDTCNGDGGWDDTFIARDHRTVSHHYVCSACGGTGEMVAMFSPITLDDTEVAFGGL